MVDDPDQKKLKLGNMTNYRRDIQAESEKREKRVAKITQTASKIKKIVFFSTLGAAYGSISRKYFLR